MSIALLTSNQLLRPTQPPIHLAPAIGHWQRSAARKVTVGLACHTFCCTSTYRVSSLMMGDDYSVCTYVRSILPYLTLLREQSCVHFLVCCARCVGQDCCCLVLRSCQFGLIAHCKDSLRILSTRLITSTYDSVCHIARLSSAGRSFCRELRRDLFNVFAGQRYIFTTQRYTLNSLF